MDAYLSGDLGAFRQLFARLAPRLHAFFARSFRDPTTPDDLLQTTFLKMHSARQSFDRRARVLPWVFGIAARVRIDALRARYRAAKRASDAELEELVLDGPDTASIAEAQSIGERVRAAVDRLPEGQRVVVHLHRFEGLSFGEVGAALGLEEGTVRVRAFRAYERLRRELEDLSDVGAS